MPNLIKLDLSYLVKENSFLIHPEFDVAVVPIGKNEGPSLNLMKGVTKVTTARTGIIGVSIKNIKRLSDVLIANEVYVFAFPSSIGIRKSPRFDYDRPLLRKGVVSGKSIKLKSIVIDTPAFKGDSGGSVLEVEQQGFEYHYRLIGLISEFIPYVEEWHNRQLGYTNIEISNSGYSVVAPADFILDLISEFESK